MKGSTRNIVIVVIVMVLLAFGIILAIYNNKNAKPMNANLTNKGILDDPNKGLENIINNILDNNEEEIDENLEQNSEFNNQDNINKESDKLVSTTDNDIENHFTPGEKKAIELAKEAWKKEWGNLDDVSFYNVTVQGDGKYVVSVNDSKTTKLIVRYLIDTITGLVEEK